VIAEGLAEIVKAVPDMKDRDLSAEGLGEETAETDPDLGLEVRKEKLLCTTPRALIVISRVRFLFVPPTVARCFVRIAS
jgi:hypothetical protein